MEEFALDPVKLHCFITVVAQHYNDAPYHNLNHVVHVLHSTWLVRAHVPMCTCTCMCLMRVGQVCAQPSRRVGERAYPLLYCAFRSVKIDGGETGVRSPC